MSSSKHAQPSAVLGRTHSEWRGLWQSLPWHDHAQNDVCRIYGWRQRCMQRKDCSKWQKASVRTNSHSSRVFNRETQAAPWCVLEKSMDWCRGVRGVPFPTTPESMSKCVNSSTGSMTSYKPTLKENHPIVSLFNPHIFVFLWELFQICSSLKKQCMWPKCRKIKIKSSHVLIFFCPSFNNK